MRALETKATLLLQEEVNDLRVLFRLGRARAVDQQTSRPDEIGRAHDQIPLGGGKAGQIVRRAAPLDVRIAADRAQARTWRVDQDRVEHAIAERQCSATRN